MVRLKRMISPEWKPAESDLNSTMVRLKPNYTGMNTDGIGLSQFHYGSIKTN